MTLKSPPSPGKAPRRAPTTLRHSRRLDVPAWEMAPKRATPRCKRASTSCSLSQATCFHSDAVPAPQPHEGWGVDPADLRAAWEAPLGQTLPKPDSSVPTVRPNNRWPDGRTPNNSLSCLQKCKCCPEPTPTPNGDAHRRRLARLLHQVPDPEIPVLNVVEMGIVRNVEVAKNCVASQDHPNLHGVPCHGCHRRRHPRATDTIGLRRRPRTQSGTRVRPGLDHRLALRWQPRTSSKLTASLLQERPPTNGHSRRSTHSQVSQMQKRDH